MCDLASTVSSSGFTFTGKCRHKHELTGTGAVFFQSLGILKCAKCGKFQLIKKPLK